MSVPDFLTATGEDLPQIGPDDLLVWCEDGSWELQVGVLRTGVTASEAAAGWVEAEWPEFDHAGEVEVAVLFHDGERRDFLVAAVETVEFQATEVKG